MAQVPALVIGDFTMNCSGNERTNSMRVRIPTHSVRSQRVLGFSPMDFAMELFTRGIPHDFLGEEERNAFDPLTPGSTEYHYKEVDILVYGPTPDQRQSVMQLLREFGRKLGVGRVSYVSDYSEGGVYLKPSELHEYS